MMGNWTLYNRKDGTQYNLHKIWSGSSRDRKRFEINYVDGQKTSGTPVSTNLTVRVVSTHDFDQSADPSYLIGELVPGSSMIVRTNSDRTTIAVAVGGDKP